MKLFLKYFRNKRLCKKQKKFKVYVKSAVIFLKMAGIDNNSLMGLLIIPGGGLLLNQEHLKQSRKRR